MFGEYRYRCWRYGLGSSWGPRDRVSLCKHAEPSARRSRLVFGVSVSAGRVSQESCPHRDGLIRYLAIIGDG